MRKVDNLLTLKHWLVSLHPQHPVTAVTQVFEYIIADPITYSDMAVYDIYQESYELKKIFGIQMPVERHDKTLVLKLQSKYSPNYVLI